MFIFSLPTLSSSYNTCLTGLEVFYLTGLLLIFTILIASLISKVPLKFDAFGIVTEFNQCLKCWVVLEGLELGLKTLSLFYNFHSKISMKLICNMIQLLLQFSTFYISIVKPSLSIDCREVSDDTILPLRICCKKRKHKQVAAGLPSTTRHRNSAKEGEIFGFDSFDELFEARDAHEKLQDLAMSHYVVEMTNFLSKVHLYKKMNPDNLTALHNEYLDILEEFIFEGSPYEINIHHQMRNETCAARMPSNFVKLTPEGRRAIFDKPAEEVKKLVVQNLVQPYGSKLKWKQIHSTAKSSNLYLPFARNRAVSHFGKSSINVASIKALSQRRRKSDPSVRKHALGLSSFMQRAAFTEQVMSKHSLSEFKNRSLHSSGRMVSLAGRSKSYKFSSGNSSSSGNKSSNSKSCESKSSGSKEGKKTPPSFRINLSTLSRNMNYAQTPNTPSEHTCPNDSDACGDFDHLPQQNKRFFEEDLDAPVSNAVASSSLTGVSPGNRKKAVLQKAKSSPVQNNPIPLKSDPSFESLPRLRSRVSSNANRDKPPQHRSSTLLEKANIVGQIFLNSRLNDSLPLAAEFEHKNEAPLIMSWPSFDQEDNFLKAANNQDAFNESAQSPAICKDKALPPCGHTSRNFTKRASVVGFVKRASLVGQLFKMQESALSVSVDKEGNRSQPVDPTSVAEKLYNYSQKEDTRTHLSHYEKSVSVKSQATVTYSGKNKGRTKHFPSIFYNVDGSNSNGSPDHGASSHKLLVESVNFKDESSNFTKNKPDNHQSVESNHFDRPGSIQTDFRKLEDCRPSALSSPSLMSFSGEMNESSPFKKSLREDQSLKNSLKLKHQSSSGQLILESSFTISS